MAHHQQPQQQPHPAPSIALGEAATAALAAGYERRLLASLHESGGRRGGPVPTIVITGFLGAGKTTLVSHLLDASPHLRIGVLVNEASSLDVDSGLLGAAARNAAAGVRARALAGGCACCADPRALAGALAALGPSITAAAAGAGGDAVGAAAAAAAAAEAGLDYLIIETSGAADAGALAAALAHAGYALDLVVAVVDAEAGADALRAHALARAQLAAADVVVLNKLDLAPLGAACDLEDAARALAPEAALLRARFGAVPPEALLDGGGTGGGDGSEQQQPREPLPAAAAPAAPAVVAEGFLSHEGPIQQHRPGGGSGGAAVAASRKGAWRALVGGGDGGDGSRSGAKTHDDRHHHDHHAQHHEHLGGFATAAVEFDARPLCMACFTNWLTASLLAAPGLVRAKGTVWLRQRRRDRYVLHLSGRRRAEARAEGRWDGPPATRLALIGQDTSALAAVRDALLTGCVDGACGCGGGDSGGSKDAKFAAAREFRRLAAAHPRFSCEGGSSGSSGNDEDEDGVAEFSAVAAPLHGVLPGAVSARVARAVNAAVAAAAAVAGAAPAAAAISPPPPPPFLCAVGGGAAISALTGLPSAERPATACQAAFRPGDAAEVGAAAWRAVEAAAAPVLRRAYAHVTNCKCDVVAEMAALRKDG